MPANPANQTAPAVGAVDVSTVAEAPTAQPEPDAVVPSAHDDFVTKGGLHDRKHPPTSDENMEDEEALQRKTHRAMGTPRAVVSATRRS